YPALTPYYPLFPPSTLFISHLFFLLSSLLTSFPFLFFFFIDTATTEIYTLSLHDALPILIARIEAIARACGAISCATSSSWKSRSEEHTSELQSRGHLVCRLLLEKKKNKKILTTYNNVYAESTGVERYICILAKKAHEQHR